VKNIGIRVALLICTPTLLSWRPAASPRRTTKRAAGHPERGDVPGWVMITLMSAVLVAALLALAGPALEGLFNQAMDRVRQ
jgi:hypothetical protein